MSNLTFKKQFAEDVKSGKKTMTIRRTFKKSPSGNPYVHLFSGLRTKQCVKLGVGVIKKIQSITIYEDGEVEIDGHYLSDEFIYGLAIADGFKHPTEFFEFFKNQYGLPFSGVKIEWKLKVGEEV